MRTIKELLQLVLSGLNTINPDDYNVIAHGGLCSIPSRYWFHRYCETIHCAHFTKAEIAIYKHHLNDHKPSIENMWTNRGLHISLDSTPTYWWKYEDLRSRINFIQTLILKIKTNETV